MDATAPAWERKSVMNDTTGLVQVVDRHEGAIPVCELRGELDVSNVEHVLERVIGSVANEAPGMVLDLTQTNYLDSAGVRILFELARRLRTRRQQLRIVVPANGVVRRVLVLTALGDVVPLDDNVDRAVSEFVAAR
jgi:anti-anti-sigma factor